MPALSLVICTTTALPASVEWKVAFKAEQFTVMDGTLYIETSNIFNVTVSSGDDVYMYYPLPLPVCTPRLVCPGCVCGWVLLSARFFVVLPELSPASRSPTTPV